MKKMRLQFTVCVRACMCVCVCERERERCCRLAHITMSTVNFKSICNNRSLAVTTQRAVHLHHGSQRRSLWPPAHFTRPCHWSSCSYKMWLPANWQESLFHVQIASGRKAHKRSHVVLFEYGKRGTYRWDIN